jgi:protein O-GlcNAc transferase
LTSGSDGVKIRLKPDFADALANLGWAYGELGLLEKSVASLRGAIAARPDHALAHFNLGIVLIKLRRDAEATAVWRILQKIDPKLAQRLKGQMPGAGG